MRATRRKFLAASLAAPAFVPAAARGANDRIAYGVIGTGNRGRSVSAKFQALGARCVALCDVYEPNLEKARQASPAGVKTYLDYNDLLAQEETDFVLIATPDHQHRPCLLAALDAGKDVYLEKPLSMSLEESRVMVEAASNTDRIVQIGMQRRSMPFIHRAKSLIDEGMIGEISLVQARWNWNFRLPLDTHPLPGKLDWERFQGPAPRMPLEPKRFRWWRGFWAYSGGNITDQGTHLMDVVQWLTGSGPPNSAVCQGRITPQAAECEVPNVFSAGFEYDRLMATWTLDYRTSYDYDWAITFRGEKGTLVLDRSGARIYDEPPERPDPWMLKQKPRLVFREADRDRGDGHMKNMLACVRSRSRPNCPIQVAADAVAGPHMANIAWRENRKVKA